jgi:hypothetical protein
MVDHGEAREKQVADQALPAGILGTTERVIVRYREGRKLASTSKFCVCVCV